MAGCIAQQPWKSISSICKDAAVFLDDSCAELLHWAGGVELLGGAVGIYDLYGDLTQIARDFIASVSFTVACIIDNSLLGLMDVWLFQKHEYCYVGCSNNRSL